MEIETKVKYEIKIIDSLQFIATLLGNITDNLSECIGKKQLWRLKMYNELYKIKRNTIDLLLFKMSKTHKMWPW